MPETTLNRKSSQAVRQSAVQGKDKPGKGRQAGDRTAKSSPSVVANSFYSLTLKAKPGIAVEAKRKDKRRSYGDEDDYVKMYTDLLACFQHALKLIGESSSFDPLASGLDIGVAIHYVLQAFKSNILPKGYEVNIDKDDEVGYHFTIFKECDFPGYWHAFETKPIIRKVKDNYKLHGLFMDVLKCMHCKADIQTWWNGGMGYAEYMLEEEIADWDNRGEFDSEEESMREFQKAVQCQHSYANGEAKGYEDTIRATEFRKPEDILKDLEKFRSDNRIVNWLKEVCEFLKISGSMNDFVYDEHEDLEGLKFDQQATIIWDFDDKYTNIQGECIDSEAQSIGVNSPMLHFFITTRTKDINLQELEEYSLWPMKLSKVYDSQQELLQSFKKKNNGKRKN